MRVSKVVVSFVHDAIVACITVSLALYLRLGNAAFELPPIDIVLMTVSFLAISTSAFTVFGVYRGVWRYASLGDLIVIVKATTVAVLLFIACMYLFQQLDAIPRSVPIIQWFLLVVVLGGSRFSYRLFRHQHRALTPRDQRAAIPVLLIGACEAAEQFIRATKADLNAPYKVVGVLDDHAEFKGRMIHGVPVLGMRDELTAVLARLASRGVKPQRLIMTDANGKRNDAATQEMLHTAERLGLTAACLPRLTDFRDTPKEGEIDLQPIALEDLLGRPQAPLDREAISQLIAGRRVLITGAGGTIGSELSRQIAALRPIELILVDFSEFNLYSIEIELRDRHPSLRCRAVLCNIRDRERVMQLFAAHQPELVFHAAALKHVPMVELNKGEGVRTNVLGTRNVADAASRYGARAMVQVSTDKAVNPTNVMGASKRLAEFYCQALDVAVDPDRAREQPSPRFMTVRFGNVLGSSGSVVPLFQRQLARGGPLTVTHPDIKRYFMTVREAVELVLQASAHGLRHPDERGQIFVLDMGEPIKIVDIARQMIRLAGLRPDEDVEITFTGLRPGEKLYEELFDRDERRLPAAVDGVLAAASQPINLEILRRVFDEMLAASLRQDDESVQHLIQHLLPGYQPSDTRPAAAEHGKVGSLLMAGVDRLLSLQTTSS
ncbi:MAG TPA: nucleoside-diphosphate sugar epimerase/dehydratase [Geminicoccaceae bacterium]|nr:nucleoside-diphosphate sugar epimerase/dehydratase [Geminicoccaceae bacterium]